MKDYIIFNRITGEIERSGICTEEHFDFEFKSGIPIIEGRGDLNTSYVINDIVHQYTVEQKQNKANRPYYPCAWSNETFEWIDSRTEQQKYDEADFSNRLKRNNLLVESDWTQLPDVPLTNKDQWAIYRQQLRDITTQSGYPFNVIWPDLP